MITDYMEDIEIENPFQHLKPWQKTPYEKAHGRNIYKNSQGKYFVEKVINKTKVRSIVYDTFTEAMEARDELIRNGWVIPESMKKEQEQKEYYKNIALNSTHYAIHKKRRFLGSTDTIEKALYYRDICKEHNWEYDKKPAELDLTTNNPYLKNGLSYPVPERLVIPVKKPKVKGYISVHSSQSNQIRVGHKYYGSYPTYEMAWYVREELNKCDFDKSQLDRIVDDYPVWYTKLMNLYRFVTPKYNGWVVNITPSNSKTGKLEHIYCNRLEDALWERDLLVKYDFDEDLLIECADDSKNPYYDMELPPYPQRKIRRIVDRADRTNLFNTLFDLINDDNTYTQEELAELADITHPTLRNILKNEFNTNYHDFVQLCLSGEHPNDVLEQKPIIYNPDITRHYSNTNFVSYHKKEKTPYIIYHRNKETKQSEYFGAYPTRELADKISNDLQACNWNKSKLKEIQAKHGWRSVVNSRKWVYPVYYTSKRTGEKYVTNYNVRKKNIGYFGNYKDKRVAELVRDLLIECDWNKELLPMIKDFAFFVIDQVDNNWRCDF